MTAVNQFKAILDGESFDVSIDQGDVLLDAMLAADLDPAFQCQEGHCGSCMALLKQGDVKMRRNNVLSTRDLEQGYILLCQSEPITGNIIVDCDE